MIKEKNKYEQLFDEWLELVEFALIKHKDGWGLHDIQGGNIGNIENDRFETATQILERMDLYVDDYIIRGLEEDLDMEFSPDISAEVWQTLKDEYPEYSWVIDIVNMIMYHSGDIDLNNCCYEEE